MSLSYERITTIYKKRWGVEEYHKSQRFYFSAIIKHTLPNTQFMKWNAFGSMLLFFMVITAANCTKSPADVVKNENYEGVEAGLLKGRVTDAQGKPLAGVKVYAGHTAYYNTNVVAVTNADGYYKMDINNPGGTWTVHAEVERQYNGVGYTFYVYADNADPVSGTAGAVRKLTWKLSGPIPGLSNGKYGAKVAYYDNSPVYIRGEEIEFTLTPDGPLVDGSAGQVITGFATAQFSMEGTAVGSGLDDVPLGRYRVSARYIPQNEGTPKKLGIRLRDMGDYADEVTINFEEISVGLKLVEVETKLQ